MQEYKRAFILGDIHWGIYPSRASSWLKMMDVFFRDLFIPFLKEHSREGDVLIQVGDWYHNQKTIDIRAMNLAQEHMLHMASILPVHMLVGNHDIWGKADVREHNSLKAYDYFPGVTLHQEPAVIGLGGKKALMMPWFHEKEAEQQCLLDHAGQCDLVFCHSDLVGSRTTLRKDFDTRKQEIIGLLSTGHGALDLSDFDSYETVYSGHIHIRHRQGNFQFVGTPYQLDTNDMDNPKGWWLVDPRQGVEEWYRNETSPEFKRYRVETEDDLKTIDPEVVKRNYCDLFICSDLLGDKRIRKQLNRVMRLPWKARSFFKSKQDEERVASEKAYDSQAYDGPVVLDRKTTFDLTHRAVEELDVDEAVQQDIQSELNRAFSVLDAQ